MQTLAFLNDNIISAILIVVFLFVSVVLILTVLIQRPQGGGLSGAFGSGSGSGQTAFGAKTGDALTIATISIFLLYLFVAVGLNWSVGPTEAEPALPVAEQAPGDSGGTAEDAAEEEGDASGPETDADFLDPESDAFDDAPASEPVEEQSGTTDEPDSGDSESAPSGGG